MTKCNGSVFISGLSCLKAYISWSRYWSSYLRMLPFICDCKKTVPELPDLFPAMVKSDTSFKLGLVYFLKITINHRNHLFLAGTTFTQRAIFSSLGNDAGFLSSFDHWDVLIYKHNTRHWLFVPSEGSQWRLSHVYPRKHTTEWNCWMKCLLWSQCLPSSPLFQLLFCLRWSVIAKYHPWLLMDAKTEIAIVSCC